MQGHLRTAAACALVLPYPKEFPNDLTATIAEGAGSRGSVCLLCFLSWHDILANPLASTCSCTQVKGDLPSTNDGSLALVLREPYGPILSISPFNFVSSIPAARCKSAMGERVRRLTGFRSGQGFTLAIRTIVYPLATGNTVLLKGTASEVPRAHCRQS